MVDSINRWLTHPDEQIRAHITETFGTEEAVKIAFGSGDRAEMLKDLYQRQLQKASRFVRYFDMRDHDNRTVYYLFFATNNRLGHLKMKEAMWKVDPLGDFRFSDATDPNQTLLFSAPTTAPLLEELIAKHRGAGENPSQSNRNARRGRHGVPTQTHGRSSPAARNRRTLDRCGN